MIMMRLLTNLGRVTKSCKKSFPDKFPGLLSRWVEAATLMATCRPARSTEPNIIPVAKRIGRNCYAVAMVNSKFTSIKPLHNAVTRACNPAVMVACAVPSQSGRTSRPKTTKSVERRTTTTITSARHGGGSNLTHVLFIAQLFLRETPTNLGSHHFDIGVKLLVFSKIF